MAKKKLPEAITKTPFGMFFSGVEGATHFNIAKSAGVTQMLMSFLYIQKKGVKFMKERFGNGDIQLLVDSGAHTFINNNTKKDDFTKWTNQQWEDYIRTYLAWAEEHKELVFAIVELDIDSLVGDETVQRWRREFFQPFEERTGIPVCYVWHGTQGFREWTRMCKDYDYVGFSAENVGGGVKMDERMMSKMIREAQKYGAVVHGFAITRPSILPKLPFFSVDSISWKMGEIYGVTYFWDGKKFHTLSKDQKVKRKLFKTRAVKLGIDWEKIQADDNDEVTRMNAIAFLEVMRYVRKRLRMKQYWLSEKDTGEAKKVVSEPVDLIEQTVFDAEFPDLDTWDKREGLREISKNLNINPNYSSDDVIQANAVVDMTVFLNQDKYEQRLEDVYTDDVLGEITTLYLAEEVSERQTAINRLEQFFEGVVTGNNDFFYSNPFDADSSDGEDSEDGDVEAAPRPKERDEYIIDDEMPEYQLALPEVDEYDDELIVVEEEKLPERTKTGKFLKGHNVRKPKNLYSEKFPKLACDTCYAAQSCPEFKAGHVCAFTKMFKKFDSRDIRDVNDQMVSMVNMNAERVQRLAIFEMLDGGMADANLTGLMNQQMQWLNMLMQLQRTMQLTQAVQQSGGDVSLSVNVPMSEGILSRIFGGDAPKTVNGDDDIIEGDFTVEKEGEK